MRKQRTVALVLLLAAATTGALGTGLVSASGLSEASVQETAQVEGGDGAESRRLCTACITTAAVFAAAEAAGVPASRWLVAGKQNAAEKLVAGCASACKTAAGWA